MRLRVRVGGRPAEEAHLADRDDPIDLDVGLALQHGVLAHTRRTSDCCATVGGASSSSVHVSWCCEWSSNNGPGAAAAEEVAREGGAESVPEAALDAAAMDWVAAGTETSEVVMAQEAEDAAEAVTMGSVEVAAQALAKVAAAMEVAWVMAVTVGRAAATVH